MQKIKIIFMILTLVLQNGAAYGYKIQENMLFSAGSHQCNKCKNGADKLKAISYVLGLVSIILVPVAPLTLPMAGIFWIIGEVLYHLCSLDRC